MAQVKPIRGGQSSGLLSGPVPRAAGGTVVPFPVAPRGVLDPERSYRAFPDLWRAWLRREYRTSADVARAFRISEKAAAKWWKGIGGPGGDKVYFACREIEGARDFLFAAE